MPPEAKPRTAAFTEDQITAGFWLIAALAHASRLTIDEDRRDEELEETLSGLVGAHGVSRDELSRAIPRILAAREAAARHELPTVAAAKYDAARSALLAERGLRSSKGSLLWPTGSRTIAVRLGGGNWNDALLALGLRPASRGRAQGSGRFDEASIVPVLAEFLAACEAGGESATIGGYAQWSRERRGEGRGDVPSQATIRQRFGTWGRALEAVRSTGRRAGEGPREAVRDAVDEL